jgi:DNA-binding NtrC family response regulator
MRNDVSLIVSALGEIQKVVHNELSKITAFEHDERVAQKITDLSLMQRLATADIIYDALSKIKDQCFSLVISDIMMPGMSGMELLRLVKKDNPETAFIMITGLMDINAAVDSVEKQTFKT